MKFALACHGMRGDVEPSVVVARELSQRGHDVNMAIPPNLVDFAHSAGVPAVPWGQSSQIMMDAQRDYWECFFRTPWKLRRLDGLGRRIGEIVTQCWTVESFSTLTSLADGADLIIAGSGFEQFAANVAEYYNLPLTTIHFFPDRANGQVLPHLPAPVCRALMTGYERMSWSGPVKDVEDLQRRELGLPMAITPWPRRIAQRGSLEIQAFDQVCFPGLVSEWEQWDGLRPFVGALAMATPTVADAEVAAWSAEGKAPVFFGFGSVPIGSPEDAVAMIAAVCEHLGERAIIGAGGTDYSSVAHFDHVKVVGQVNYATIFPTCRAVVHHGGAGTFAAALRAGVPQLILWTLLDQPLFATQLKRMKVGAGRRFSTTTQQTLIRDLGRILAPEYAQRAQAIAPKMSTASESVKAAADLVENFVGSRTGR